MKMKYIHLVLSCLVLVAMTACTNDEPDTPSSEKCNQSIITVGISSEAATRSAMEYDAFGPTISTRVAYDDSHVGTSEPALTWEVGDQLVVTYRVPVYSTDPANPGDPYRQVVYTLLSEDAGKAVGRFVGDEITDTPTNGFNISYRCPEGAPEYQIGSGTTAHLKREIGLYKYFVEDLQHFSLEMTGCIIRFDLTNLPADLGKLIRYSYQVANTGSVTYNKTLDGITISEANRACTLFLWADKGEKPAGTTITLTLVGDKMYSFQTTLPSDKNYEAGNRYVATINKETDWQQQVAMTATNLSAYNGMKIQLGRGEEMLEEVTVTGGQAKFLHAVGDEPVWFCVPRVVKFFHTMTFTDLSNRSVAIPDKDGGCVLRDTPSYCGIYYDRNEWQVALYMGINKGGSMDPNEAPLYWATGNLIATKVYDIMSYRLESLEKMKSEAPLLLPQGITEDATNGYGACGNYAEWDKFGWGDITGLKTHRDGQYYASAIGLNQSICGNAEYDIARATLGSPWRLPTGHPTELCEIARFGKALGSSQNDEICLTLNEWKEGDTTLGAYFKYDTEDGFTNWLYFPITSLRVGAGLEGVSSSKGFYWSGTSDDNIECAASFNVSPPTSERGTNLRDCGLAVRPVSE